MNPVLSRTQADRVADSLVDAGLVTPDDRHRVHEVVARVLGMPAAASRASGGVSSLVEVVAYLGAALVLAASGLFVSESWGGLDFAGQVGLLSVTTLVLAGGALLAAAADRAGVARRDPTLDTRRRLAGTLLTAAALGAATVTGMVIDRAGGTPDWDEPALNVTLLGAAAVGLVVVALGYRAAPTVLGLLGLFVATCLVAGTVPGPLGDGTAPLVGALLYLATAVAWLALTERGVLGEADAARVLGVGLALWAVQMPLVDGVDLAWVTYLLTATLAVVSTTLYLRWGAWPYLAVAVVATTVVVPEAVTDWTDGGLGVVGAVLLTGVTLLLASLVGAALRSRRERDAR